VIISGPNEFLLVPEFWRVCGFAVSCQSFGEFLKELFVNANAMHTIFKQLCYVQSSVEVGITFYELLAVRQAENFGGRWSSPFVLKHLKSENTLAYDFGH
jgi:hypothetical protein